MINRRGTWSHAPGLHEHVLTTEWFDSQAAFEAAFEGFFERPSELVLGEESAGVAGARFEQALRPLIQEHREGDVVVVSHGRVISLFAAPRFGQEVYPFWKRLGLPALVALGLPDLQGVEVIEGFT